MLKLKIYVPQGLQGSLTLYTYTILLFRSVPMWQCYINCHPKVIFIINQIISYIFDIFLLIDIFGMWMHAWSNGGHWVLFVVHVCACCYPVPITGGWWVDLCKPVIWNWSLPPLSIHVCGICLSWMTCMGRIELQQGYQWTHVYNSNSENVRKSVCCIELNVP